MTNELRAAAERMKSSTNDLIAGDLTMLAGFASELLTREWLDAPDSVGWWWWLESDKPDDDLVCLFIEPENISYWQKVKSGKWQRAYVPEMQEEKR